MRWFYELYPNVEILPQAGVGSVADENLPQAGVNLSEMVFHIPSEADVRSDKKVQR